MKRANQAQSWLFAQRHEAGEVGALNYEPHAPFDLSVLPIYVAARHSLLVVGYSRSGQDRWTPMIPR
jgi:hypothetical protein